MVTGVLLALLMGALDNFVVLTALPTILTEFGAPNGGTFVISGYIIASTVGVPIFGKLSDLWSRRNVFLGGLVLFIAGSILSGVSQNLSELIAFRAVQGFGAGDFFPVGVAIVAVTFPPEARARVTGLLSGVFGIATVAGPLLGNAIITYTHTWRWLFYVNLPIGLAGLAVIALVLGPLRPEVKRPFDVPGAALLFGWVAALMYPLIEVEYNVWGWGDPHVVGLLATAGALAAIFVVWELKVPEPLVPLRLLSHRVVAASGGSSFMIGMVFFPLATLITLAVGYVFALGSNDPSSIVRDVLYALVLPLVVGAALGGQLLTRLSFRAVVLAGLAISLIGLYFLLGLTASTPTWRFAYGFLPVGGLILPLMPLGFGVGLTFPVFLLATQNQVPKKDVGEASSLIQFLQSLGGSISLSVLATFQASRFQTLDPSPSPTCQTMTPLPICGPFLGAFRGSQITAFDETFMVMLVFLAIAFGFAALLVGRMPRGEGPSPPM